MKPAVHLIVAIDRNNAIGRGGDLVYRLREDLRRFKKITTGNTIVMGRRTWESLPCALPNRRNIVVSRQKDYTAEGAETAATLQQALAMAADGPGDTYILGGAQLYRAALPLVDVLDLTYIDAETSDADTFFPAIPYDEFEETGREEAGTTPPATFITLKRKNLNDMPQLNVLLLGSGGRESALAYKIAQSPELKQLYIAPGNAGTTQYGINLAFGASDFAAIAEAIEDKQIDLVVVGPEDPLVNGLREALAARPAGSREVAMLGPGREGARLEGSKDYAKVFMQRHGIPTAKHLTVSASTIDEGYRFLETLTPPYVLKADGLAAGKGVLIEPTLEQAKASLKSMLDGQFGAASATVVIEEFLTGIECSVFVITDGSGNYRILAPAKDYKRAYDGDRGLNTGGMGAVCPPPFADEAFMQKVEQQVVVPTIKGLMADGIDYRGFIFLGLMNSDGEPKVIEYNVRMGDPETEVVMPRIASDVLPLFLHAAQGKLTDADVVEVDPRAAVTVVAVAGGYPGSYKKGDVITGNLHPDKSIVFQAGTKPDTEGRPVTAGGRVLAVTSLAENLAEAAARSYRALEDIHFDGMRYRSDISKDVVK